MHPNTSDGTHPVVARAYLPRILDAKIRQAQSPGTVWASGGYFLTGLPGPEAFAEVTAKVCQERPAGAPFEVIVEFPPDE